MIGSSDVAKAATRIADHIRSTPVISYRLPDSGKCVGLKLEMLQHTGSFKVRGAFNKLLTATVPESGVVAASGGNHGLAVAYAARTLGVVAEIFVPALISGAKLDRLRAIGATVTIAGDVYSEALAASTERAEVTGALAIHAYDDPAVVAGQGTTFRNSMFSTRTSIRWWLRSAVAGSSAGQLPGWDDRSGFSGLRPMARPHSTPPWRWVLQRQSR